MTKLSLRPHACLRSIDSEKQQAAVVHGQRVKSAFLSVSFENYQNGKRNSFVNNKNNNSEKREASDSGDSNYSEEEKKIEIEINKN